MLCYLDTKEKGICNTCIFFFQNLSRNCAKALLFGSVSTKMCMGRDGPITEEQKVLKMTGLGREGAVAKAISLYKHRRERGPGYQGKCGDQTHITTQAGRQAGTLTTTTTTTTRGKGSFHPPSLPQPLGRQTHSLPPRTLIRITTTTTTIFHHTGHHHNVQFSPQPSNI